MVRAHSVRLNFEGEALAQRRLHTPTKVVGELYHKAAGCGDAPSDRNITVPFRVVSQSGQYFYELPRPNQCSYSPREFRSMTIVQWTVPS